MPAELGVPKNQRGGVEGDAGDQHAGLGQRPADHEQPEQHLDGPGQPHELEVAHPSAMPVGSACGELRTPPVGDPHYGEGSTLMSRVGLAPMLLETKGDPVRNEPNNESLMEETGLGLLPGVVLALAIVVFSMALLLTGSTWALAAVLVLVGLVTASILAVVIALVDDGELGDRLRRYIPGLPKPPRP